MVNISATIITLHMKFLSQQFLQIYISLEPECLWMWQSNIW